MSKCKCIQKYENDDKIEFSENSFYNFEFVPTTGNTNASYRVYTEDGKFVRFAFTDFKVFFKSF